MKALGEVFTTGEVDSERFSLSFTSAQGRAAQLTRYLFHSRWRHLQDVQQGEREVVGKGTAHCQSLNVRKAALRG